ncbi:MAG: hypothetical protein JO345_12845 [Streptosporangiaceae bacterium]|nr:hypothetical protein [Streptosporangiaceae bacterium]
MRTAVVICCCLGLAACTVAPSFKPDTSVTRPAVGHPAPPSSVQAATSSEAFTPYQELGQSNDDGLAPNESYSALSKACLTDTGFPNAPSFGFFVDGPLSGRLPYGPWGYLGVAEAEQDGFQPGFLIQRAFPNASGPPSAAEQKAMEKCDPITGKFFDAEGHSTLAGISTLTNDIKTDVQHDPSVLAATKAWSACMAQNGYKITDPQTAFQQALRAGGTVIYSGGSASGGSGSVAIEALGGPQNKQQKEAEIALAVTDADCTESTDLAGIYFAVQASYEQQLVNANQQALNAAVEEFRADYQKELTGLPKLLGTTKAGLPTSGPASYSKHFAGIGWPGSQRFRWSSLTA